MLFIWRSFLLLLLLTGYSHASEKCPKPMVQLSEDVKGKVEGDLNALARLGKLKARGDVETITSDVLHKYPNADQVALQQNTLSILCEIVLPSPEYGKDFKERIMEDLVRAITRPPGSNKDKVTFDIIPNNPGKFQLAFRNRASVGFLVKSGKFVILGQPTQSFDMTISPQMAIGLNTTSVPPGSQGSVMGTIFSCLDGQETWQLLYSMRYDNNRSLDQRQCRMCTEIVTADDENFELCRDLQCGLVATPTVGQGCGTNPNRRAGACRTPDGNILPRISPSGCISRGGDWLMPTNVN